YSAVTIDIDGDTRDSITPDIGADEFFPATLDAGISNIDSPMVFCAGTHNVKASFTNYGTDTIKSLLIDWRINGGTISTYSWSGSVAPGISSSSITLGNATFATNTAYTFKAWSRNPNGGTDGKTLNDTITRVRYAGLSGTYTIGDTSIADYKSFNDAITDMTARGICGAVTINVYPGVYNEQITLVQLPGMGQSRPLVFQSLSADSTQVRVTLPSTTATGNNNAAIQLRGADYVSFRRITFERTGTNPYGHVVHILNGSSNNTFQGCQMRGLYYGAANANANNIWSDQGVDHNNAFIGNYVCQGNVSMLYTGTSTESETGTVVEGNVFDSAYASTVQISYNKGVVIRRNTFGNINFTSTTSFDVQLNFCDSSIRVIENRFNGTNTNIAVHLVGCLANSSYPGIIANNFITKSNGRGILLEGVEHQKIYYNSLNLTTTNASNTGIEVTNAGSSGIEFKNNIITMAGGNIFNVDNPSQIDASDYNNLYTTGSTFAIWGTGSYSNLAAFQAMGVDSHSLAINPIYYSSVNLHVKSPDLKGKAVVLSAVTTDIDGQQRHNTNPDIGADEFELLPNDAGITAIVNPAVGTCSGDHAVKALVKNFGKDTLKNVSIEWSVGGVSQTTYSWTGNLITNASDTVTLSAAYSFSGGTTSIFAKTVSPNGQTDEIGNNDSSRLSLQIFNAPPQNAGPDKILCLGDSILIGGNPSTGYTYSWTDATNNLIGTTAQIYVMTSVSASYFVKMMNNSTGCNSLDTMELTVMPKPTLNAGVDRVLCAGFGTSIGEPTPQTGHTYQWTSQPSGFTSINSQVSVSPSLTTSYMLRKTNISSGCSIIDTVTITVIPKKTPSIQGPNNICNTDTVSFSTTPVSGGTYTWTTNGATIVSGQQTANVNISWNTTGNNSLMLVLVGPQGCTDTGYKNVTIMVKPDAQMVIDGNCAGDQISFTDQSTNTSSRSWNFGDGGTSIQTNTSHVYTQAGTYQVTLVSRTGLCYDTASQVINVDDPPVANFNYVLACAGESTDFYDSSGSAVAWFWDFGGDTSSQRSPSHVFGTSGSFAVKLRVTGSSGCLDSLTKFVSVKPVPNAGFTYIVDGDSLRLSPLDTSGIHSWDFGDGQYSSIKYPVHRYAQTPLWVVVVHSIDGANGCSSEFADSVFVGPSALNQIDGRMDVQVYPNPFRNELIVKFDLIETGSVRIRLFDASGKELLGTTPRIFEPGQSEIHLDTRAMNLAPGLYFIEVDADGAQGGQRVVKVE
ncbi:MAG: PKD domain-containing protein, partial [Bacteroidia bacterium]